MHQPRTSRRSPPAAGPWSALLLLWLAACSTVSTYEVDPIAAGLRLSRNAVTADELSMSSRQILRLVLVDEDWTRDPDATLRELSRWQALEALRSPAIARRTAAAAAETALLAGRRAEARGLGNSSAYYLEAAVRALELLLHDASTSPDAAAVDPDDHLLAQVYSFAVGRMVAAAQTDPQRWIDGTEVATTLGPISLRWPQPAAWPWGPDRFRYMPADEVEIRGLRTRVRFGGVGAPLVAVRRQLQPVSTAERGYYPIYDSFYPLTAVLKPRSQAGDRAFDLELFDSLASHSVSLGSRRLPLASDLTAPLAVLLDVVEPDRRSMDAMRHTDEYLDQTGLYLLEPYRPDKIPLVLVHGLQATGATWATATNELRADPVLRDRYQLWYFNYPTGAPYPYAALLLRRSLERALDAFDPGRRHPTSHQMVLAGHSMGGLLIRLLVTDVGDALYDAVFARPPEQLGLGRSDLAFLHRLLSPEPMPGIARVVFVATPHRGSVLASGFTGMFGAKLANLPDDLLALQARLHALSRDALRPGFHHVVTQDAVSALAPGDPLLLVLADLPMTVPFHSLLGNRGKAGVRNSFDGAVTFASGHLDGALSEVLVPSNHIVQDHPAGIAELRRILYEHLLSVERESLPIDVAAD